MIIAQISDLHLRGDGERLKGLVDSEAALAACAAHVNAMTPRPDVVLATGDLANKGLHQDYEVLRRRFASFEMPVYAIPGNHDDREKMRAAFASFGYLPEEGRFLHYTVEDHPLRLIGLDTVVDGGDGGELCRERLDWLAARLDEGGDRPTLLFMHHPPFATGIGFMDKIPFIHATEAAAIVAGCANVVGVACGHLHRAIHARWGGTIAATAPSIVFQMALELRPGAPSSFVLEPAGVPVYVWTPELGLVIHSSVVGDFGPRHPFHPEPEKSLEGPGLGA